MQNAKWDATSKLTASLKECEAELRRVRARTSAAAAAAAASSSAAAPPRPADPAALYTAARASVRAAAAALSSTATDAASTAAVEGLMSSPRAPPSGKRPGKLQARVTALQEQVRGPVL